MILFRNQISASVRNRCFLSFVGLLKKYDPRPDSVKNYCNLRAKTWFRGEADIRYCSRPKSILPILYGTVSIGRLQQCFQENSFSMIFNLCINVFKRAIVAKAPHTNFLEPILVLSYQQ